MKLTCSVDFWSDNVGCFCHEAITRALNREFGQCKLGENDRAYAKFKSATDSSNELKQSAWFEFLRNGPSRTFVLPSGTTGKFSRYRIEFDISNETRDDEVKQIRSFLNGLKLGPTQFENAG